MVGLSLEAAEILKAEGIDVEVINMRSIRPLDIETIKTSVMKTNRWVISLHRFPPWSRTDRRQQWKTCNGRRRFPCFRCWIRNLCSNCRGRLDFSSFLFDSADSEIRSIQSEAFDYLDAPVERITGADLPTPVRVLPLCWRRARILIQLVQLL